MINPFTDPPKLLLQALEDIGAIADVARRVPELEAQLEGIVEQVSNDLGAVRGGLERLESQVGAMSGKLDDLKVEMAPIGQLPAMREAVEPLDGRMQAMSGKLDGLREEMAPIQELPAVRRAIEPLGGELGGKMDGLVQHVDDIEPMFDRVVTAIEHLVPKIEEVREAIAPVGDVIENLPKFMRN